MKNLLVRLGLAFADNAQERAFSDRYVRLSLLNIQVYALLGGVCFYSFHLLDKLIDPTHLGAYSYWIGAIALSADSHWQEMD
jgi:hypothetical protein